MVHPQDTTGSSSSPVLDLSGSPNLKVGPGKVQTPYDEKRILSL